MIMLYELFQSTQGVRRNFCWLLSEIALTGLFVKDALSFAAHLSELYCRNCCRSIYIFYLSKPRIFAHHLSCFLNIVPSAHSRLLIDLWIVHLANILMKNTKKRWRCLMRIQMSKALISLELLVSEGTLLEERSPC
ncbi:hypothetical protein CAEBREN_24536 [Caenorhabditis brenneri]|uniref:Uncharacterized protein n=1 Tax=Caenorhabditis brenneri TaxID=135651 RepID=G0NDC7_CAEBE|nr:hypothetical protein CAEBREN_24536 [Caenorhabditis brenneri]